MTITVNTNIQSIFAQRALSTNTLKLQKSTERLSTGLRINRAADDAAGLSISEKLTSRIIGYEKAIQNAGDGISLIQTAEGGLSIIHDNLQRIRELVVQGLNGTNSQDERDSIQQEINEIVVNIQSISVQTTFNGKQLLNQNGAPLSEYQNINLQIGTESGDTTSVNILSGTPGLGINITVGEGAGGTNPSLGGYDGTLLENVTFQLEDLHLPNSVAVATTTVGTTTIGNSTTSVAGTVNPLAGLDTMIQNVSRMRSYLGAVQNSLDSTIDFLGVTQENAEASRSRIRDVDIARESSELIKSQILQQSAAAMLSQANQAPQLALSLLPGQ